MARADTIPTKDSETDRKEQVTVLRGGSAPEVTLPPVETLSNGVKGSALDRNPDNEPDAEPAPGEPPPVVFQFGQVIETKVVHCARNGGRVTMKAGKVLSSQHYDLAGLAKQGLRMREIKPDAPIATGSIFTD